MATLLRLSNLLTGFAWTTSTSWNLPTTTEGSFEEEPRDGADLTVSRALTTTDLPFRTYMSAHMATFISDGLAAGSVTQTISIKFQMASSGQSGTSDRDQSHLRLVAADGTVKQSLSYYGTYTNSRNSSYATFTHTFTPNWTVEAGDRLVWEVGWYIYRDSTSVTQTWKFWADSTAELTSNDTLLAPASTPVNYIATPMTASVMLPGVGVSTTSSYERLASAMTGSVMMPTASISVAEEFAAPALTASAGMPSANVDTIDNIVVGAVPMTASASAPNAVARGGLGINVAPMTATATSPDATYQVTETIDVAVTKDTYVRSLVPDSNFSTDTVLISGQPSGGGTYVTYVNLPTISEGETPLLRIYVTTTASRDMIFRTVDRDIDTSTVTWNTRPAEVSTLATKNVTGGGWVEADLTNYYYAGRTIQIFNGGSAQTDMVSSENVEAARRPVLRVSRDATIIPNTSFTAPALTASAAMPAATVAATDTVTIGALPATASAMMAAGTGAGTETVSYAAQVATATARMPDVKMPDYRFQAGALRASAEAGDAQPSIGRTYAAAAMTASAAAPNGGFSNQTDKTIYAQPAGASARMVGIYIAAADPYRTRLIDFGATWYDLANFTGGNLFDPITGADSGDVVGTPTVHSDGPGSREYVTLDAGEYFTFTPASPTSFDGSEEISFKTAKSSGRILYGYELTGQDLPNPTNRHSQLYISNGFLAYRRWDIINNDIVNDSSYVTRVRVDDDKWHHVSVRRVYVGPGSVMELYVDGQLAIRRGVPGLPTALFDTAGGGTESFEGEMMWVSSRSTALSATETVRQYYAFLGYTPVAPTPMRASMDIVDPARVRGNETRVLCLYNKFYNDLELDYNRSMSGAINNYTGPRGRDAFDYAWSGMLGGEHGFNHPYDPANQSRRTTYPDPNTAYEWGGTKLFFRNIYGRDVEAGGYRDFVTDELRLIDLDTDVNIADFDIVFFADYEVGRIPGAGDPNGWGQSIIRKALDLGMSVWCPQPQLALDLGIVDNVAAHDWMRDRNNVGGNSTQYNYDYISPRMPGALDPGTGAGTRPSPDPDQWIDTHFIMNYRITGTLEGFSEPKGYTVDDMGFFWRTTDLYRSHSQFPRLKFRFLENGLAIGEEHPMNVDVFGPTVFGYDARDAGTRRRHIIGMPPGTNIVGTVVAQEQAKLWHGDSHIDNPYKDWALTVAVQPGDILRGKPVNGKIFVDFMGGSPGMAHMRREVGSQSPDSPYYYGGYDIDGRRTSERFGIATYTRLQTVVGGGAERQYRTEFTMNTLIVGEAPESILLPNMSWLERAFSWLKIREELEPGATRFRATAMTASVNVPEPDVTTQKSVSVGAAPMRARAAIVTPVGIVNPNAEIHVFPMTAHARLTGFKRVFHAGPMTATADMPMATIEGEGETIPLYITFFEPDVYIKEGV